MKKHILTIDDEAEIRELLGLALEARGYRVSPAASPEEARKLMISDQPDLIITDLQLEQSDGLTLVQEIKTTWPDIPVILLTGVLFDQKAIQERIHKKVSAYLPKTAPLHSIIAEVNKLIGP